MGREKVPALSFNNPTKPMALLRLFEILGFILTVMALLLWFFKALYGEWPWKYLTKKADKETSENTEPTTTPEQ